MFLKPPVCGSGAAFGKVITGFFMHDTTAPAQTGLFKYMPYGGGLGCTPAGNYIFLNNIAENVVFSAEPSQPWTFLQAHPRLQGRAAGSCCMCAHSIPPGAPWRATRAAYEVMGLCHTTAASLSCTLFSVKNGFLVSNSRSFL